ncbi:MAG: hypothetical protein KY468_08850 [Armatimonadetes bacterium]|nr:hypothetical protein [Armatimonadota bacterium]
MNGKTLMLLTPDAEASALNQREAVRTVLQVLRRTLGLRIALVARIAEGTWTACAVLDDADFGLQTGDQLDLSSTY